MPLHANYVNAMRKVEICTECAEFSVIPGEIADKASCSRDADPWEFPSLLMHWETGRVPKTCSRIAVYDTLEVLRRL